MTNVRVTLTGKNGKKTTTMKNILLGLLVKALYMYVVLPIFIIGGMAWLWVPMFFEFKGAVAIGIVASVATLVIAGIVEYKLEK